jgi:hypothetical protein
VPFTSKPWASPTCSDDSFIGGKSVWVGPGEPSDENTAWIWRKEDVEARPELRATFAGCSPVPEMAT